jgi:Fungal fruit body lectin
MSYTITASIYQTNTNAYFEIVEKTVWHYANGGTWTVVDGKQHLTMGGSGTSGILRFQSGNERFIVALGVHNYKRWVDVSTALPATDTAVHIHPDYYTAGNYRATVREKQLSSFDVTSPQGRRVQVIYTVAEGNNLACNIIIH